MCLISRLSLFGSFSSSGGSGPFVQWCNSSVPLISEPLCVSFVFITRVLVSLHQLWGVWRRAAGSDPQAAGVKCEPRHLTKLPSLSRVSCQSGSEVLMGCNSDLLICNEATASLLSAMMDLITVITMLVVMEIREGARPGTWLGVWAETPALGASQMSRNPC